MPIKEEGKTRKKLVVEEVGTPPAVEEKVEIEEKPVEIPETPEVTAPEIEAPAPEILTEVVKPPETPILPPDEPKKTSSLALWIIIPGIFLLGAILGGIVFYQKGVSTGETETPTPTESVAVSPTPSASPSASVDLTKYTVAIFNGSGISGEAGRAKTLLTTAGFKTGTTANAATYDYTKTIIKAKSTVEAAFVTALSTALGKTYVVDTAQTLSTSSADTVQVIIGSSKAK